MEDSGLGPEAPGPCPTASQSYGVVRQKWRGPPLSADMLQEVKASDAVGLLVCSEISPAVGA